MVAPYYVEPEYWEEGYAEGDAKLVSGTASASLTVSALALRINDIAAVVAADLAASATAQVIFARITPSATMTVSALRVRPSSASVSVNAIFAATARLKWEPEADTPETWTDIAAASGTWTDVPDTSEIWTEVA